MASMTLKSTGARSGVEKCDGPRPGDSLLLNSGARVVVVFVDSNINGPVYVCVDSMTSADRIVMPKEIHVCIRRRGS